MRSTSLVEDVESDDQAALICNHDEGSDEKEMKLKMNLPVCHLRAINKKSWRCRTYSGAEFTGRSSQTLNERQRNAGGARPPKYVGRNGYTLVKVNVSRSTGKESIVTIGVSVA